jgi:hypothetical protein
LLEVSEFWFFVAFLRYIRAPWLYIMRASKEVPLTPPPFGAFLSLRFSGHSGPCCLKKSEFWFFFSIFQVPTSTVVTHYESLQGVGTPLWGSLLVSVQWPFIDLLHEVFEFWFLFGIFEVTPSTIVMHYESLQGGAVNSTPLWGIFLASVQWPFRDLLPEVYEFWFFFFSFLRYLRVR